jgi:hypothetical protein
MALIAKTAFDELSDQGSPCTGEMECRRSCSAFESQPPYDSTCGTRRTQSDNDRSKRSSNPPCFRSSRRRIHRRKRRRARGAPAQATAKEKDVADNDIQITKRTQFWSGRASKLLHSRGASRHSPGGAFTHCITALRRQAAFAHWIAAFIRLRHSLSA